MITPYGNNHWNGKEKIDISKEKDDAVILEISAKGKRAIQLKEKNEFEQDIVQVDKSADDLPAYSGMYDVDKTISSSLENCSKEEQGFVYDIIRENFLIGNGSSMSEEEYLVIIGGGVLIQQGLIQLILVVVVLVGVDGPLDNGAIFQGGGGFILSDGGDLGVIVIEAALR